MESLIVYATKHGCTKKAAEELADALGEPVTLVNLKEDEVPDLSSFDAVMVGGSIHAGQIQGRVRKFCKKNLETLLQKRLGLFICCMYEGKKARDELDDAFPQELRDHAVAHGLFGGILDFEKMGVFARTVVRKVAGVEESSDKLDHDTIRKFAAEMKKGA
jgi:menaquinone-dependent protoporphyrinogen oxidase